MARLRRRLELAGEVKVKPVPGRPGFAGYQFGAAETDEAAAATEKPLEDLPATDAQGKAKFQVALQKLPETTRPLEATVVVRMAETGGRAVERSLTLPVTPSTDHDRGQATLCRPRAGRRRNRDLRRRGRGTRWQDARPQGPALRVVAIDTSYQWYRRDGVWQYEPVKRTARMADGHLDVAADKPGRIALPVKWGRYRLDVTSNDANEPTTSVSFDAGFYAEAGSDTPDMLEIALDKPEYRPGEPLTVSFKAAFRRQRHDRCVWRQAARQQARPMCIRAPIR